MEESTPPPSSEEVQQPQLPKGMGKRKRRNQVKYDWDSLLAEWLSGNETIHQFAKRKGFELTFFYKAVDERGWHEKREQLRARALAKLETRLVNEFSKKYTYQTRLWKKVEGIAARLLERINKRTAKAGDNDIIADSEAMSQLEALTKTLERALKSQKLIAGEPFGDPNTDGGVTISHQTVVALMQAMRSRNPQIVAPESIPAEVVKEPAQDPPDASSNA